MPWFSSTGHERVPHGKAHLQDVYRTLQVVLNHAGGFASTLSNIALTLTRYDARLESIANDVATLMSKTVVVRIADDQEPPE